MIDWYINWLQSVTLRELFLLFVIISGVFLLLHLYTAWIYYTLAKKTKTPQAYLAWIPIVNFYLVLKIARMSGWWFWSSFLIVIPFFGFWIFLAISIYVWYRICQRRGYSLLMAILSSLPLISYVARAIVAWFDKKQK
ncbi:MAG: hypothetical protein ACMXYF_04225 [Candidatus Woesearchaeota archaeon]